MPNNLSNLKSKVDKLDVDKLVPFLVDLSKLWGHSFMTSTKNYQFFDPQITIDLLFKNNRMHKHVTNFKTPPPPFCVDVINVWSLSDVVKNDVF